MAPSYSLPIRDHTSLVNYIRRVPAYEKFQSCAEHVAKHHNAQLVCELCGLILEIRNSTGEEFRTYDAIDHDHDTGHHRGRLCQNCNTIEGKCRSEFYEKDGITPKHQYKDPNVRFYSQVDKMMSHMQFSSLSCEKIAAYLARGINGIPLSENVYDPTDVIVPMDTRPE